MNFDLTGKLSDEIITALDNQEIKYFVDAKDGILVEESKETVDQDRFYELPEWDSSKGFELREDFVNTIRIPVIKEELQGILHSGRGVFKNFRIALKKYPEVEKRWFIFKNKTMGLYINDWYNELREIWGLEKLDYFPESDENLIHDDFLFKEYDSNINKEEVVLHTREFFLGKEQDFPKEIQSALFELWSNQFETADNNGQIGFICRSLSDDFAGCITTSQIFKNQEKVSVLTNLFVPENFRGLGIGTELISMCFSKLQKSGIEWILLPNIVLPETLQPLLSRMGFEKAGFGYAAKVQ